MADFDRHIARARDRHSRGDRRGVREVLRKAEAVAGSDPVAWRAIGDLWHANGDPRPGGAAHLKAVDASVYDAPLLDAAQAIGRGEPWRAEEILRTRLQEHPSDVAALRMFAELATSIARYADAERALVHALELAPDYLQARHVLAAVHYGQGKLAEALTETERLLTADPKHPAFRALKAAILVGLGEHEAAIALYRELLAEMPEQPRLWMSLGHALKAVGRVPEAVAAYRTSLEKLPGLGESWWSLANLKTYRFADADVAAMEEQLAAGRLGPEDRLHFEFALGKALEDAQRYPESFGHYSEGNRQRRAMLDYDPDELAGQRARAAALFTPQFFAGLPGGNPAADPIFIVGMPRSGSTLVEQILSSHPLVEGTMELPDLPAIVRDLTGNSLETYPELLAGLSPEQRHALGQRYLDSTRVQRRTGRPFFIDKLPGNFLHIALIQLILPNAKIVDVRRNPLACCFSCFKQHFAAGQGFAYDLTELGRYYSDYAAMMRTIDRALPGRVHRVIYEELVADLEGEVRRLLAHLGLPFDPACLAFHRTERAVRTPSAEQVRQPIFADGIDQWRHFEAWLDSLKAALGDLNTD
jgi:tetratricopeptide (TPR) repeat protein